MILKTTTCLLFCLTSLVTAQESCTTPNNANGDCIVITRCNSLLALLQKSRRTQQETQFLRNSQCGSEGRNPKVCCEKQAQPTNQGGSRTCTTPEGTSGTCKDIYQCPVLLTLFNAPKPLPQNVVTRLRQSSCQGPARINVCCGSSVTRNPVNVDALLPRDNECGRSGDQDRIVGGNETSIDQYPWMALVEYRTRRNTLSLSCAASLISKRYLITAGHCVTGDIVAQVGTPENVRLGEWDKTTGQDCVKVSGDDFDCNDEPVSIRIEEVIPHPQYLPGTASGQKNDIALLRIASDAPVTDFIKPVCLPKRDITVGLRSKAINLIVAGWGTTETNRPSNKKLHLSVPFVTLPECQTHYQTEKLKAELWDKQICAGGEAGKDSCRGDSGGPLVYFNENKFDLIGVVSFGPSPCALANVAGVYTNVYGYLDWIRGEIKP